MRRAFSCFFAVLMVTGAAFAQENQPNRPSGVESWDSSPWEPPHVDPGEAERRGLLSPEVQESLMPEPTPQGTRPPEPTVTDETRADLYTLLSAVRRAPPGLDGRPIPRPNPLASEPAKEMTPHPAGHPEVLFMDNYVE